MADDISFDPDHTGIAELLVSPGMHEMTRHFAEKGKEFAKAISPDAPPYGQGYIASFQVDSGLVENMTKEPGVRAVSNLVNTSEYATAVELGWDVEHGQRVNKPGYHVLQQTAAFLGDPIERLV